MPNAAEKIKKTVQLDASTVEIEERGVKLRLTVVDTPGFGDAIDNTNSFQQIIRYIDEQYERYLKDESGLNRKNIIDNRVHCCFYFINPYGHGLKPLDIEVIHQLFILLNLWIVLPVGNSKHVKCTKSACIWPNFRIFSVGMHLYPRATKMRMYIACTNLLFLSNSSAHNFNL